MRKILVFVLLTFVSSLFGATGWYGDYIIINSNNGGDAYYWIGSDPSFGTELNGNDFGVVASLKISGADMKYWSDTQDRGGGSFFYKITLDDGVTEIVAFTEVIWIQSYLGGNDYQGVWSGTIDLLTLGLEPNTSYKLHIYAKSWDSGSGQGDIYLSNGGANYVASFTTSKTTTWSGSTNNEWATETNWLNGVPNSVDDVIIPSGLTNYPTISSAATIENITIASGASLKGSNYLTVNGTATMQRSISAYTTPANGWHLLSSPVNNMLIAGSDFEPGVITPNLDDFYAFSESTWEWLNYKVGSNNITNFVNGIGYLVSYETTATKDFTGTLNNSDVTFTNLTKTADKGNGWHLLGNPFQAALRWTNTDWARSNIAVGAKIMNSGGTYTDITVGGLYDIIPANQGFFVQATVNANNSITIPISQCEHNTTSFYKSAPVNMLTLKASDGEFYVETWIQMIEGATEDYDEQYDVNFLGGMYQAPYLYSIIPNEGQLSTNRIPLVTEHTTVPLAFKSFLSKDFTITALDANSFGSEMDVLLEDTQENIKINLKETPEYTFMANAGELSQRFVVHFYNVTGITEQISSSVLQAYTLNNQLFILGENGLMQLDILDMQGRVLERRAVQMDGSYSQPLNLPAGVYMVRVYNGQTSKSVKVISTNR